MEHLLCVSLLRGDDRGTEPSRGARGAINTNSVNWQVSWRLAVSCGSVFFHVSCKSGQNEGLTFCLTFTCIVLSFLLELTVHSEMGSERDLHRLRV